MGSTGIHEHYKLVHSFWHGHACLHEAFTRIPIQIKLFRVRVSAPIQIAIRVMQPEVGYIIQIASRDYDLKSACKRFSHYTNDTRHAYYFIFTQKVKHIYVHVA